MSQMLVALFGGILATISGWFGFVPVSPIISEEASTFSHGNVASSSASKIAVSNPGVANSTNPPTTPESISSPLSVSSRCAPIPGVQTFHVSGKADYADAGDGVMNVSIDTPNGAILYLGTGKKSVQGGPSNDIISVKSDNTKDSICIDGGPGEDNINGGGGNDTIWIGERDYVVDRAGSNTFIFAEAVSNATIEGFNSDKGDVIDFTHIDADSLVSGKQSFTFGGMFTEDSIKSPPNTLFYTQRYETFVPDGKGGTTSKLIPGSFLIQNLQGTIEIRVEANPTLTPSATWFKL